MDGFFKMKHISSDYRREARRICDLHVDRLAIIYLVYMIIMVVVSIIDSLTGTTQSIGDFEYKTTWFNGVFSLICGGPFAFSFAYIARNIYHGYGLEPKIENLFDGFKDFSKAFILNLLQTIYVTLWSLLFVIPGIVKGIAYSMSCFIAIDNKEMTANECIRESQRIMNGHKMEFFSLMLSYIGWLILCALTLGILSLWVVPRIQEASYLFYLDITGKGLESEQTPEVYEILE